MRVLHVCESIIGGTGTYLDELIPKQIERYGSDGVVFLVPRQQRAYVEEKLKAHSASMVTYSRPTRWIGLVLLFFSYWSLLLRYKPDIVHAHSTLAGWVVRLLRPICRGKVVFCPHGWAFDMEGRDVVAWGLSKAERFLSNLSDIVIVISEHEYRRAIQIGIKPERLRLVLNGIGEEAPALTPAFWSDKRLKVLFAGRHDRQKGLDVLLDAVRPLAASVHLRVIGEPVTSRKASTAGSLANVDFLGWQTRRTVAENMLACDLLAVPSRWEGFGLVAVEAMRLGVPVLATRVGGLTEVLDAGQCGFLVKPEDPDAIRLVLETVSPAELAAKGRAGQARFQAFYTAERMCDQIDGIYAACLSERGLHPIGAPVSARRTRTL